MRLGKMVSGTDHARLSAEARAGNGGVRLGKMVLGDDALPAPVDELREALEREPAVEAPVTDVAAPAAPVDALVAPVEAWETDGYVTVDELREALEAHPDRVHDYLRQELESEKPRKGALKMIRAAGEASGDADIVAAVNAALEA